MNPHPLASHPPLAAASERNPPRTLDTHQTDQIIHLIEKRNPLFNLLPRALHDSLRVPLSFRLPRFLDDDLFIVFILGRPDITRDDPDGRSRTADEFAGRQTSGGTRGEDVGFRQGLVGEKGVLREVLMVAGMGQKKQELEELENTTDESWWAKERWGDSQRPNRKPYNP